MGRKSQAYLVIRMPAAENDPDIHAVKHKLLENLQYARAELNKTGAQLKNLQGVVFSVRERILEVENRLAGYFADNKNPFKLVLSRMLTPGAMTRNRKKIESELKALKADLNGSNEVEEKFSVEPVPHTSSESLKEVRHHVIITGTGRAGTTFLMELLTSLGLDTGYQDYANLIDQSSKAGLEKDIREENTPYIVKNPSLCDMLAEILEKGSIVVDHAFVPVRDIGAAARSRERVVNRAISYNEKRKWGGFWDAADVNQQEAVLRHKLSELIVTLAQHDVATTLLAFPRLVQDAPYLYAKLQPVLGTISFSIFEEIYHRVARPNLVTRDL